MSIERDTDRYETWLRDRCDVVQRDLDYKHARMAESPFVFLRATYYRWARKILDWCPDLAVAPDVLAIGDAHTENFGTWRDGQGRLVWGLNDFDDAAVMPYPLDLVRLVTSVLLAPKHKLAPALVCDAVVHGYRTGLEKPRPALLDERELWLREHVQVTPEARKRFWTELDALPDAKPPRKVAAHFKASLPGGAKGLRFASRVAGGGGLGRPRFVAIAEWRGGRIVREAKALVPSAWDWARGAGDPTSLFMKAATGRYRSPDPFLETEGRFIFRRLAADSRKVELGPDAGKRLKADLITEMARDLGALHAATPRATKKIQADLADRDPAWLERATGTTTAMIQRGFERWTERKKNSRA